MTSEQKLLDSLNGVFKETLKPHEVFVGYNRLLNKIDMFKELSEKMKYKYANSMYILTVVIYRIYKYGFNLKEPVWDEETINHLLLCAEYGSGYAWYDLAHIYKINKSREKDVLIALEMALEFGCYWAFKDLEEEYKRYYKEKNIVMCHHILTILNKYYTRLLKKDKVKIINQRKIV